MPHPIPDQAPAFEGFAELPAARLWYADTGGDGEPVVLCHPASQSSRIWLYQQPVLAAAGYRVIAYCRRGIYRSERGDETDRGTSAGDLVALVDTLGLERAHLVGAAAGGIVALAAAVRAPKRVASLTLAGTIFSIDEDEWRQMYARLGMAEAAKVLKADFLELGPSYRAREPEGTAHFLRLEHEARPQGRFDQPSGARVTWQAVRGLTCPVLLLTGEADLYAPPPLQQLVARHLPQHETATLREVGHAPYWESPDAFNGLLLDFLRRHPINGAPA